MTTHNLTLDKNTFNTSDIKGVLMMLCLKAIAVSEYVGVIFKVKKIVLRYSGEAGLLCEGAFTIEFERLDGKVFKQNFQMNNVKEAPGADVIAGHIVGAICRDMIVNHSKKKINETSRFIGK